MKTKTNPSDIEWLLSSSMRTRVDWQLTETRLAASASLEDGMFAGGGRTYDRTALDFSILLAPRTY